MYGNGNGNEDNIKHISAESGSSQYQYGDEDLKSKPPVHIREYGPAATFGLDINDAEGSCWRTGFRQRFPWVGFGGLMVMLISTAMAVAILVRSDNKRVHEWPFKSYTVQPNVLINVANQASNLGLITLIGQGLAIAWWRRAMRGASLNTLHRNHAYSYNFLSVVTAGRHFNALALAALMTKFAIVDSTLFQKATKTVVAQQTNYANATVTAWMETEWPANSGGVPGDNGAIKTIDANWANVIDAFNSRIANNKMHDKTDQLASFTDCPFSQECKGRLQGYGFSFDCATSIEDVDYGAQREAGQDSQDTEYPVWDLRFDPVYATDETPYASVRMSMLYVDSHDGPGDTCPGTLTRRICNIRPAVVEMPITVMTPSEKELESGNIVAHVKFFDEAKYPFNSALLTSQIDAVQVIRPVDLNEREGQPSTVGAMAFTMNNLFRSSANLTFDRNWDVSVSGSQAQSLFFAESANETFSRCFYPISQVSGDDPAIRILRKMNTLGFVASLYLQGASQTNISARAEAGLQSQTILTAVTGIVEVYHTDFGFLSGALVASFFTIFCVLPVYYGFWQLGRKVTLSPLEIAHAFRAPIVLPETTKSHHGDFDEVLLEVGKRKVEYGQLRGEKLGEMGIAEPERVCRPTSVHGVLRGKDRRNKIGLGALVGGLAVGALGAGSKG